MDDGNAQFSIGEAVMIKFADRESIPAKVLDSKYIDSRVYYDLAIFLLYKEAVMRTEVRHIDSIFVVGGG